MNGASMGISAVWLDIIFLRKAAELFSKTLLGCKLWLNLQHHVIKTEGWALNNWTMESVVSLCVLLLLRVSDLQYDLAGLVWCARKHALRMACLRKRQH